MRQHSLLIERAKELDISVMDASHLMRKDAAVLDYGNTSELIIEGVPTSWINVRSQFYCDNKQLTKLAYQTLGIPHPKSIIFDVDDQQVVNPSPLASFFKKGWKYVCKPVDNTNGIGVQMDLTHVHEIDKYILTYGHLDGPFMIEEQIEGKDLRIHLIEGEIIAACIRVPAFIVGNGKNTVSALIEQRMQIMKIQNPNNFLDIDDVTISLLKSQQVELDDIPHPQQKIQLKYISNMAQGGVAIDVTDQIHPQYQEWATALADYLGTGYMGLDFITTHLQEDPISHSSLLEINARADWLHHTFSENRQHDMAGIILNHLFDL